MKYEMWQSVCLRAFVMLLRSDAYAEHMETFLMPPLSPMICIHAVRVSNMELDSERRVWESTYA